MKLASHNSWSYLTPKKWWMKLIKFTAKCQRTNIIEQYLVYDVRYFDLRVRFDKCNLQVVHGKIIYDISEEELYKQLRFLNNNEDCVVRVILDIRDKDKVTSSSIYSFNHFCDYLVTKYKDITFVCGECLATKEVIYDFKQSVSCEEKYASVCKPKLIDDWYPLWYAKRNNHKNIQKGTDKDYLMLDFVDIE